jgi:hypothetical protein
MANALGTLFSDIANAIRGKTGDTGTMKPAEFPAAITGISVGSGGDTVVVGGTKFQLDMGSINGEKEGRKKVQYYLDNDAIAVIVHRATRRTQIENDTNSYLAWAYGFDSRYFNNNEDYYGLCKTCYAYGTMGIATQSLAYKGLEDPIDTTGLSFTNDDVKNATNADITLTNQTLSNGAIVRFFELGVQGSTTWIWDNMVSYEYIAIGVANDE